MSNSYELRARLVNKGETRDLDKCSVREFHVETGGEYSQVLPITVFNKLCSRLDDLDLDAIIDIKFGLRGRKYKDRDGKERCYLSAVAFDLRIAQVRDEQDAPDYENESQDPRDSRPAATTADIADGEDDNLPF